MSHSSNVPYIELHVPDAKSEQEFLVLAVQAAVKKYRETRDKAISPPLATLLKAMHFGKTSAESRVFSE
jgi:hypothetical protein